MAENPPYSPVRPSVSPSERALASPPTGSPCVSRSADGAEGMSRLCRHLPHAHSGEMDQLSGMCSRSGSPCMDHRVGSALGRGLDFRLPDRTHLSVGCTMGTAQAGFGSLAPMAGSPNSLGESGHQAARDTLYWRPFRLPLCHIGDQSGGHREPFYCPTRR